MPSLPESPSIDNLPTIRRCSKCGQEKPLTADYWRRYKQGFQHYCKLCQSEYSRKHQAEHRDERRESRRKYRASHESDRQHHREYQRRYRAENPEKVREGLKRWSTQNADWKREYNRSYRAKHQDKVNDYMRRYYVNNIDKMRKELQANGQRRRARQRNLPAFWSPEHAHQMFAAWNYRCAYCGNQQGFFNNLKLCADHYIPLSADENCPGTVPHNMVPACKSCNSGKQGKAPREWLIEKFGVRKGKQIAKRIEKYLSDMKEKYKQETG